eukprot:12470804-Alexandrium_andersonii.AAC.1
MWHAVERERKGMHGSAAGTLVRAPAFMSPAHTCQSHCAQYTMPRLCKNTHCTHAVPWCLEDTCSLREARNHVHPEAPEMLGVERQLLRGHAG